VNFNAADVKEEGSRLNCYRDAKISSERNGMRTGQQA
jgi:hypothetical protein